MAVVDVVAETGLPRFGALIPLVGQYKGGK